MHLGGANSWGGMSLDEKRGMLFMPTGSISPDFWGGKRKGMDLFANCVIALDAATGKMKWYYQVVHHDLWDRDPPTAPVLVTVTRNGRKIDAVSQATKFGFLFVLNRVTGKPIFPVHETPVPTENALDGEDVWPTQPIPTLPQPYARQTFSEKDINPYISAESKADLLSRIKTYRYGQLFFVPGKQTAVAVPGFEGGAEWGGSGFDPQTGLLYINASETPYISTMVESRKRAVGDENFAAAGARLFTRNCVACHGQDRKGSGDYPSLIGIEKKYTSDQILDLLENGRRMMPPFKQLSVQARQAIVSYITNDETAGAKKFIAENGTTDPYLDIPYQQSGFKKFETLEGLPAISPPWGTLNAINLSTGKIVWKVPLGEEKSLMDKGIPITGTQNFGGPVVTAGGLIFIAATKDEKIRAFDKRTGKELWEAKLPFAGFATPSTYQVNGRQYLVVACGGGKLNVKSGDAYVAFALPGK
jgi:quinoprotein glucose dehydrogenase